MQFFNKEIKNSPIKKLDCMVDAGGRTRTGTEIIRLILSQVRLPSPPLRHYDVIFIFRRYRLTTYIIISSLYLSVNTFLC